MARCDDNSAMFDIQVPQQQALFNQIISVAESF